MAKSIAENLINNKLKMYVVRVSVVAKVINKRWWKYAEMLALPTEEKEYESRL